MAPTLENYKYIAQQAVDTIGKEIDSQIEQNPRSYEFRFIRPNDAEVTFHTYALGIQEKHSGIDGFEFIDAPGKKELGAILNIELPRRKKIPREIKLIRPNHGRDAWGIFFR